LYWKFSPSCRLILYFFLFGFRYVTLFIGVYKFPLIVSLCHIIQDTQILSDPSLRYKYILYNVILLLYTDVWHITYFISSFLLSGNTHNNSLTHDTQKRTIPVKLLRIYCVSGGFFFKSMVGNCLTIFLKYFII